jgi:hypothetical protein
MKPGDLVKNRHETELSERLFINTNGFHSWPNSSIYITEERAAIIVAVRSEQYGFMGLDAVYVVFAGGLGWDAAKRWETL